MNFELLTAFRYLVRSRSHKGFVSFFTFISILCVTIGVAALIVVLAVMTGFERELKERVIGMYAHVTVLGPGRDALANWHVPAEAARSLPHVLSAAPYVTGPLLLGSLHRMRFLFILGVDTLLERQASDIQRFITVGSLDLTDDQIIIGDQVSKQMALRLGDKIQLTTAASVRTPSGSSLVPMHKEFTIAGFFHTGNYDYDANFGIVTLKTAQQLYSLGSRVHALKIRLSNVDYAPLVRDQLQQILGPNYSVRTWMDQNPALFSAIQMEKRVMFIILLLISVVAALNIVSTLVMVVLQKTKEIGILRALGATKFSVGAIFTAQGLIISLTGALLGITGGVLLALNIDPISKFIEAKTGFTFFPSNVYYLDAIPSQVVPSDVCIIATSAIILSLLASLLPAALAARLDPVQALRYE
ncbi:MAG: lipoprotein-releasing ABC transporter permease subunit [bacterium]|nr:lipoprotein-releasing ABC transporter permease subunit [bacterium]